MLSCQKNFLILPIYVLDMLIVKIDNKQTLERALKNLKSKVIKTKQNEQLKERKNYTPNSVKKRNEKLNAIYRLKFKDSH